MNTDHKFVFEVTVSHDESPTSPVDNDCFEFLCFDRNSIYFVDAVPEDLKLDDLNKTWWPLSVHRHGNDHWFLRTGPVLIGTDCNFDTTEFAGILRVSPDILGDNPTKIAEDFLKQFNDWVNGDCWQYQLRRHELIFGACPRCHCGDNVPQRVERTEERSLSSIIGSEWATTVIVEDILEEIAATGLKKEQVAIWLRNADNADYIVRDVAADLKLREIPLVNSLD